MIEKVKISIFCAVLCELIARVGMGAPLKNGLRVEFPAVAGEETLVRFPVAVRLSEQIDGFTYRKYNESDIRFVTEQNEEVPFEIDIWNTSGESLVWVQVPELKKGTALYIRATGNGKKDYTDKGVYGANRMWADYAAVWHMDNLVNIKDATGNGYDAALYVTTPTPAGLELRLDHAGPSHEKRLGAAVRWPGNNTGYIGFKVLNDLYQQKLHNQAAISVEAAVSLGANADSASYARIFQVGNTGTATAIRSQRSNTKNSPASNKGYGFMTTLCTEQQKSTTINAGTPHPEPNEYAEYVVGEKFYTPGALAFHGMSYDGAKLDNFTGNAAKMISLSDSTQFKGKISREIGSTLFTIGCRQENKQNWYDGEIDELRLSAVPRSAVWMENSRRSMLSPETFVSFTYIRGAVPEYDIAEGETVDVSHEDWKATETDRIIVDGLGTLNLGSSLPLTITLRGNNTLQIDDTGAVSPSSNLVFDHDEASVTLDILEPASRLQNGKPIEVLTGTSFRTVDERRVTARLRVLHTDGTVESLTDDIKVSIVNGTVYLTYGTSADFEFDIETGSLTINAAGTYDLAEYNFPIKKLVINKPVTLKDYQMGNDLAGRPSPAIDLTLGAEGAIDLQLLADDNYFVGQEALLFSSVTGDREDAIRISWTSTGDEVDAYHAAKNGLLGVVKKEGGCYLFEAMASQNPLIDIRGYQSSFVVDFPSFTDDRAVLTNFPVGVVFSNDIPGFNYTSAHSDSLRFVDEYGNNLPYEIEGGKFNKLGKSVVWVRVPYFHKDITLTACIRMAGDVAPVFEGDRAMCAHPLSTDEGFDPSFARLFFNPLLDKMVFSASETNDVVDVSLVDFSEVRHPVVKRGVGAIRFGASVPDTVVLDEGTIEFMAEATPRTLVINGAGAIKGLPTGNDLADIESSLAELVLEENAKSVEIEVKPSPGLYVGYTQVVIRNIRGDASLVTVKLASGTAVTGDLRLADGKVRFTCLTSEVPLVTNGGDYWCEAEIAFPQMTEDVALTNFPVAVRFNEAIDGFRYRTANFETLRFSDAAGNDLPYEIDGFNEKGTTLVWVMVPYFAKDTTIKAYWGLDADKAEKVIPPATAHVGPRAPFHNYAAVWHMDVRGDNSIFDSTQNGFDLRFFGKSTDGFAFGERHIGKSVTWPVASSGNGWAVKNGLYEKKIAYRSGLSTEIIASSSPKFKIDSVLLCTTRASNFNHGYLKVSPGQHGASRFHVTHTTAVDEHLNATVWNDRVLAEERAVLENHEPAFFGGVFNGAEHLVYNYFNLHADSHTRDTIDVMPLIEGDVSDVRVGSREGAVDYDYQGGMVDEVRVANRARSSDWMRQIYHTFFTDGYSAMTLIRDGSLTNTVVSGTADVTGVDYDTRVLYKKGAGSLILGSAPDILHLDAGTVEFTRTAKDDLPFEVTIADGTTLAGLVLAPTNTLPSKITVAEGAKWSLVLNPPDLLWEKDVVTVIPRAEGAVAENITVTLTGPYAREMQVEPVVDASGAIRVRVTKSPRGLQKWSTYTHMMTIYFNGYKELETLENFPALVRLTNDIEGFDYSQFVKKPTDPVFDLRFADYQGNEIPYEIDTWEEDGESLIWVSVPKLQAGGRILMYWGLAKDENGAYKELLPTDYTGEHGVWKEYDVVYHFNEIDVKDETENHNDPERFQWLDEYFRIEKSAVGHAIYFATNTVAGTASRGEAQRGYILPGYYENWMLGATNHTIECIATMSKSLQGYAKIMSATRTAKPGVGYSTANYLYRLTADGDLNGMWGSFVYTKDGPASNGQRWYSPYWTPNGVAPKDLDANVRVPVFMGCVFDGVKREYTDYTAGKYATRPIEVRTIMGESTTGYDPVSIGFRYGYNGQSWFDNMIDELRLCRKARSPAWMNAVNFNALKNGEFCQYSVEGAHGNEKPIINAAVVEVNAAGANLLVTLPNAGVIDGERMGQATIYGKVWELVPNAEAEPANWETFGVAQEGHYISSARMIYQPERTYRAVVYAETTAVSGKTLQSNVETNDFTTLSRGIRVNQEKTTGDKMVEEHHARVHTTEGGSLASTAVLDHPGYVELLVVGAGGSGGHASPWGPGSGGGAGGLFYRPAMWVEAGSYEVFASGPTASGTGASEVTSPVGGSYFGLGRYQVSAGGRGMSYGTSSGQHGVNWSVAGGSGGGGFSSSSFNMTMGTGDQGFWGGFPAGRFVGNQIDWASWAGAGGGGATRDGETSVAEEDGILGDAGQGGEGRVICITGREEFYGGGGGGGVARSDDNRAGEATYAGGGAGGDGRHLDGHDGVNGTGGGGGGGAWYPGKGDLYPDSKKGQGGAGGSGIVVWRYTPIPADVDASPVVMFSEIRGDNMSANLTIPVVCLGEGKGEAEGTYEIETDDDGDGHYKLTRTDQVCTLYFRYGVDRFNLDHEVKLTDKAHLGEHLFKVTGLLRNQAYWGRIRAVDGVGHEFQTRELPFETTDEGDDSAIDVGYPRLGDYSYVTTNGHEVVFTGRMETRGLYDVRLYLATNVNDLVCKSGEGAWNACYSVRLNTADDGDTYTIAARDLVPGTRYWYLIEAADADPSHAQKTSYAGLGEWYEKGYQTTIPMKDRTHHQYTTFVTPRDANLSRTYREAKDFENAEDEVPVTFSEVLKETGSLPARLELCITQINEATYGDDNAIAVWPLTTSADGEGGCGLYSFQTNFPYGTMIKYHWRVVNTFDEQENTTDQIKITTYVGNPNLFYWIRPSSAGVGNWWDPSNWHNPNENYKDTAGRPLPLNKWPLPNVDSTVIFTNMIDGAWVNVTGRCDILRVNLSIGTNKVTFIGANAQHGHAGQAELITKFFKTSGSGSALTFDNIKVPFGGIDFDWMRESYLEAGSSGTVTHWRDVDEAYFMVTNKADVALRNLTFAPLAGELRVSDKASLSVASVSNSVVRVGGGVHVTIDDATMTAGSVYLQHADNAEDSRYSQTTSFDFKGEAPQLVVERVIGNRLGAVDTPFTFRVPLGGWTEPVVWHKGIAGLSAFGFGFERDENVDENGAPILIPMRGTGGIVAKIDLDSPAFRSVRTVNPTLIRADHGFWNDDDPYIKWWVSESHGLGITPRSSCEDIDRNWRRTNEVYYDQEDSFSGNYGSTRLKARITGKQRTVLAIEAHDGEVVHRRGTVTSGLGDYRLNDTLPAADPTKWSFEKHSLTPWNDSYVRTIEQIVLDAENENNETNRELYIGVDEGLLAMTAIKNMDSFSTYIDINLKVKAAWTALEPIDFCDKAKIAVTFDEEGRLCVVSGALADTDQTVTNVTDIVVSDESVVRLVIQAARNVQKKEYFKIFVDGRPAVSESMKDLLGAWLVPDAQDGKVFPARTVGKNPIGMGKIGLNGAAIMRDLAVGARPPKGYEETLTKDTVTADGTHVPVPYSYIDAVRTDNTTPAQDIATSEWKNGYKLWASYALGLDPTDEASVFWTNGRLNVENARNYLMSPMNVEPPEGSLAEIGYKLQYSADRKLWADAYSLMGDEANFQINKYASMTPGAASYVRLAATVAGAEIPSINTFGALKVDSARTRTIVAVPWVKCDRRTSLNAPIALSEYLTTGELDENDCLFVLDATRTKYLGWAYQNKMWTPITILTKPEVGSVTVDQGGAAEETELPRGGAVWLLRQNPMVEGQTRRFHVVGQVPDGPLVTKIERGGSAVEGLGKANLVANPTGKEFDFSDLKDGVDDEDKIHVPQDDGSLKLFTFKNSTWGTNVSVTNKAGNRVTIQTKRVTTENKVPVGEGFWYESHGGAPEIKWTEEATK